MNIIEAISNNISEVTELTDTYIGKIYAEGLIKVVKPVDVRLNKISIPLSGSDINFIYDTNIKEERVYNCDAYLNTYFPAGSEFMLFDKGKFKLISYGPIKRVGKYVYVDMYCTMQNKDYQLVETIECDHIKNRIRFEMDRIIESNEIIKSLLPEYDSNWLKFSDDDINAIEVFNALNVLSIIDTLEYNERYNIMKNINSFINNTSDNLPKSIVNMIKDISEISTLNKIKFGFLEYHSLYNPRYVFESLIYMYENMLLKDEILYTKFYLLNKLDQKCLLTLEKVYDKLIIHFNTPSECKYNFTLNINNYTTYGDFVKYNIESINLFMIDKNDLSSKEITSVSTNQSDYLKVCTEIFTIISASNYENITLSEYYSNIESMLNSIDTSIKNVTEEEK